MNTKLEKLVEQYKKELSQRQLTKKSHLESVREFAGKYHCSPTTAAAVFKHLLAEGIVSSVPGKGYFLQKNPARKKKIGYLGYTPSPLLDSILYDATSGLLDHLESQKEYEVVLLQFRIMQKPEIAAKLLQELDGLLLSAGYVDENTLPLLRKFNKPVVIMGANYLENRFICNQVIADFSTALKEFFRQCDVSKYSRIVIVQTKQKNSEATAMQIMNYLEMADLKIPFILEKTNEPASYGNITYGYERIKNITRHEAENTLFIVLSGLISIGMYSYMEKNGLAPEALPDVLSVDNFESYDSNPEHTAFFTAIDRCSKDCFIQGAELLFNELRSPSHHRVILQIPTRLVIRKSIKNINKSTRSN